MTKPQRYFVAWHPGLGVYMDHHGNHTTSLSSAAYTLRRAEFAWPWVNIGVVLSPKSVKGQDIRPSVVM